MTCLLLLATLLLALASAGWAAESVRDREAAGPARIEPAGRQLPASLWRLGLAGLAVAGLLYGGARLFRRLPLGRLFPGGDGAIRIEGRTFLGPREYLCLVRVGGRTVLIGVSAGRIAPLYAWPEADAPATTETRRAGEAASRDPELPVQLRALHARLGTRSR